MSLKETVIKYAAILISGFLMTIVLTIGFICKRSEFPVKKRKVPPKDLTDSALWKHGYLSLTGIKIHYVEKGDPAKPLMLFLHGFPEFWYSWRHQLKEFSKDYWTVAIDMRGYGDSEKPSGIEHYAMDHLVNDVKQVAEALGRQKFILVGHDWGGVVAWNFVLKHHDMLQSYIILNSPYTPTFLKVVFSNRKQFFMSWITVTPLATSVLGVRVPALYFRAVMTYCVLFCRRYLFFYTLPYLPEIALSAFDFIAFAKVLRRKKPKDISPVTDEDIEAYKYTFGQPGALTPPINYYRHFMKTSSNTHGSEQEIDIDPLGILIFGDLDDYLVNDHIKSAQKYVKNLQVRIVKGANHFVQQDDPDTVNRYIREFLISSQ